MKNSELILLILAVLVVTGTAAMLILRSRKTHSSAPLPSPLPRPLPPQAPSIDALVDTYCDLLQQTEQRKALDAYRELFNHAAPLYQALLGALRRTRAEDETQPWLAEHVSLAFDNLHPTIRLTETGFEVTLPAIRQVDTPALRARCQATSPEDLGAEIQRLRAALAPTRLAFQAIIRQTGPILYNIREAAASGKPVESLIDELSRTLEANGCLPRYFDDPEVHASEGLRAQFVVESSLATETPGLYIREGDQLHLIGMCAGTVRGNDA